MSEFMSFLSPPGSLIDAYERTKPCMAQSSAVPQIFRDAMSVREDVFVHEQGVPLENELDSDDPRSYHWVVYASVNTTSSPDRDNNNPLSPLPGVSPASSERRKSSTSAYRVPVGTIRLVPPPHPAHPKPGSVYASDNAEDAVPKGAYNSHDPEANRTSLHDGKEPYIKIGRVAVLAGYRGLGLSRLLANAALEWAAKNPETILPPPSPASREAARLEGREEDDHIWKGQVLVHAQTSVQGMWEKMGFVKDQAMGTWIEEGIEHVGLWRRLNVSH